MSAAASTNDFFHPFIDVVSSDDRQDAQSTIVGIAHDRFMTAVAQGMVFGNAHPRRDHGAPLNCNPISLA
jgi:hypothetical protein